MGSSFTHWTKGNTTYRLTEADLVAYQQATTDAERQRILGRAAIVPRADKTKVA